MQLLRTSLKFFIALMIFGSAPVVFAAKIKAVKGKKVLVDLETETFQVGDVLKIENENGKTVGLTKLTKIKGHLAEGLLKGVAEKGQVAKLRPAKSKSATSAAASSSNTMTAPSASANKTSFGGIIGFNSTSAKIKLPTTTRTVVSPSGTGFSAKALMDYPLLSWLNFRGMVGLEQFNVGGVNNTESNGCGGECTANINYLSFDFWGRYVMSSGSFRPWLGVGASLAFPLSKESTALDESTINNISVITAGGGFDWALSDQSYMPIQLEYDMYPSSEDVSANTLALRIGFAKTF